MARLRLDPLGRLEEVSDRGNWWEEDWVGEELVGGVEGVARKEGWEDEQLEKAPGKGK